MSKKRHYEGYDPEPEEPEQLPEEESTPGHPALPQQPPETPEEEAKRASPNHWVSQ